MTKIEDLNLVSDPVEVNRRASELGLNEIHPSSRKDKKYMVFNGTKMVHFGAINYEDATKHKNIKRINNFRKRNHKWKNAEIYSPAFLSYYLLW
jgi:hypothetical protein